MGRRPQDEFERTYMSEALLRENEGEVKSLERMLEEDRHRKNPKIQDEHLIREEIAKRKELIKQHGPHQLKGQRANKAYAEARELEGRIKEAMLSGKEFKRPYPTSKSSHRAEGDFEQAVQHEMRVMKDKKLKKDITRYKAIMRNIDPSDPTLTNIERLRK